MSEEDVPAPTKNSVVPFIRAIQRSGSFRGRRSRRQNRSGALNEERELARDDPLEEEGEDLSVMDGGLRHPSRGRLPSSWFISMYQNTEEKKEREARKRRRLEGGVLGSEETGNRLSSPPTSLVAPASKQKKPPARSVSSPTHKSLEARLRAKEHLGAAKAERSTPSSEVSSSFPFRSRKPYLKARSWTPAKIKAILSGTTKATALFRYFSPSSNSTWKQVHYRRCRALKTIEKEQCVSGRTSKTADPSCPIPCSSCETTLTNPDRLTAHESFPSRSPRSYRVVFWKMILAVLEERQQFLRELNDYSLKVDAKGTNHSSTTVKEGRIPEASGRVDGSVSSVISSLLGARSFPVYGLVVDVCDLVFQLSPSCAHKTRESKGNKYAGNRSSFTLHASPGGPRWIRRGIVVHETRQYLGVVLVPKNDAWISLAGSADGGVKQEENQRRPSCHVPEPRVIRVKKVFPFGGPGMLSDVFEVIAAEKRSEREAIQRANKTAARTSSPTLNTRRIAVVVGEAHGALKGFKASENAPEQTSDPLSLLYGRCL